MRPTNSCGLLRGVAVALLLAGLTAPAQAVVITTTDDSVNVVAPGNGRGWDNVGRVASASGVYLGNRWVITAAHVSGAPFRLDDGREFAVAIGSPLQLDNPAGTFGRPDLRMFRLAEDPGLAGMEVSGVVPVFGSQVTLIGAGIDRARALTGWQVFGSFWNEVRPSDGNVQGFELLSSSTKRWGVNRISSGQFLDSNGGFNTVSFSTRFDTLDVAFEAQATPGDSGGGTFALLDGRWQLAGIITGTQRLDGQPEDSVVFGNQTVIADLSSYRDQILDLLEREEPLWQNPANHFDVSRSGGATVRDLHILINEFLRTGGRDLDGAPLESDWLFDVNGDYRLSVADVQHLINGLLSGASNPSPSAAGGNFVPEPSSAALAAGGLLLLGLYSVCRARFVVRRGREK